MHTWLLRREKFEIGNVVVLALTALTLAFLAFSDGVDQTSTLLIAGASALFAIGSTGNGRESKLWKKFLPLVALVGISVAAVWFGDIDEAPDGLAQAGIAVVFISVAISAALTAGFGAGTIAAALTSGAFLATADTDLHSFDTDTIALSAISAAVLSELTAFASRDRNSTQHVSQLRKLNTVTSKFGRPEDIDHAAEQIVDSTTELFNSDYVTVVLRSPDGELVSATGGKRKQQFAQFLDDGATKHVVSAIGGKEPKIVRYDEGHLIVCPIQANELPAGAVVSYLVDQPDSDYMLVLAELYSGQLGTSIEHLYVFDELEKATRTDELTGIGNRKHANQLIDSLNIGDALILLDLDGFKAVNDTYGHSAGDQVLLDLSNHLKSCLRDSDTSARLGGDEFLVVAKRAFADPEKVARRILEGWDVPERSTTLSAGVALHEPETSPRETYDRADEALYQAKSAGKNQSRLWSGSVEQTAET